MAAPVDSSRIAPLGSELAEMDSYIRIDSPVHYRLRPPTPGRLVSATWDRTHNPPRATSGHVVVEYPFTDGLVVVGGLYAVTDGMRAALEGCGLTGFTFGPVACTRDPHMVDMRELPRLHTLVLTGRACRDDVAPWRCESLALSLRAARTLWQADPQLLPRTTVLDVIGLPD
ncbi:hypothetical protein [Williamsia deligens]|uniref:Uncharacterized protein n=1 Tax=Williamsia deligens TaxID=321325 RepID=A0ABW3G602_9NOCA|nr:hypothetical protein [Williamsia deligens]MCP2193702.1 hypothetical protein [Williamsia deligens]